MNAYTVTITEIVGDQVHFVLEDVQTHSAEKRLFPGVAVGQTWEIYCRGSLVFGYDKISYCYKKQGTNNE